MNLLPYQRRVVETNASASDVIRRLQLRLRPGRWFHWLWAQGLYGTIKPPRFWMISAYGRYWSLLLWGEVVRGTVGAAVVVHITIVPTTLPWVIIGIAFPTAIAALLVTGVQSSGPGPMILLPIPLGMLAAFWIILMAFFRQNSTRTIRTLSQWLEGLAPQATTSTEERTQR